MAKKTENLNDWMENGEMYILGGKGYTRRTGLPKGVYNLIYNDKYGCHLELVSKKFEFDHKLYGVESVFIKRIMKTFKNTSGNLGVLMNGIKGTGKTVSTKVLANELDLPVITVTRDFGGALVDFLKDIRQDVVIMFDEFEKVFDAEGQKKLLTLMDGLFNGDNRKVFLMTTNETYLNNNLLSRPSRIRYLKNFKGVNKEVLAEIIDDRLNKKSWKDEIMDVLQSSSNLTIDIVLSVIDEVNIHDFSPKELMADFNVQPTSMDKYDVYELEEDKNGDRVEKLLGQDLRMGDEPWGYTGRWFSLSIPKYPGLRVVVEHMYSETLAQVSFRVYNKKKDEWETVKGKEEVLLEARPSYMKHRTNLIY